MDRDTAIDMLRSIAAAFDRHDLDGILEHFAEDPETDAVMMIGEIGGPQEAEAGHYIRDHFKKPVVAYIAGLSAPKGRRT